MLTQNLLTKPSVKYNEQLLQYAIVDAEFRVELLSRPEEFGLTKEEIECLPSAVEQQNMSFVELVIENDIQARCGNTCVFGFTLRCDGNTQPNCRRTCVSGYTIRCDGATV